MFGATSSALTRTEEIILDAFEIGMQISRVRLRWDEFVRNIDTKKKLCQSPVSLRLRRARLKWFSHVEKMGEERQVRKFMNAEVEGKYKSAALKQD